MNLDMTKTQNKRRGGIKTKLLAAICMLLVSSIMMVSTTYAWFTLSTAPEVKGINTAVGANGNLEMALLPKDGLVESITSAAGDSLLAIEQKNVTWGNLVDLSDSAVYGLDAITLYPAALNVGSYDTDGYLNTFGNIMLKTPVYGNDGRVATLNPNTVNGYYDATEKNFMPNSFYGVRAVGTASGMTDRQLVYRNARSSAATAAANAKSVASQSLNTNGSTLANVAIKKGTGNDSFNLADLNAMKAIVNDLLGTTTKTGSLEYIETAYMQYILAYSASAAVADLDKDEAAQGYKAVQGLVTAADATLTSVQAGLSGAGVSLPGELTAAIAEFQATKTAVTEAGDLLDSLIAQAKASYTWAEISPALYKLADPDNMEVNGIKAGEIMQDDNMSDLVNSVASGGLKVTMKSEGGVYADIADHCGDYTASVVIEEVTYDKLTLKNTQARMETKSSQNPAYLTAIGSVVETAGAPASGNTTVQPITDMFGYVIDLAFRTNAAASKLLLQGEGIDRIYSDNANEGTMGSGTNMTFTTVSNELSEAQIRELLGAIRLVFFTPGAENNTVILCAKLDATNATFSAETGWKANLVLYKQKQVTTGESTSIIEETLTTNEIMDLEQNTPTKLSVLVYLDGEKVGNEDVAASAATSMVGKLNLQFASSATLVPMDYSQLHTPNTAAGTNP